MPPLTRHTHYAALPRAPRGSRRNPDARTWTRASAVQACALFVQEEGRHPNTSDLRAFNGMPSLKTICKLFSSLPAYQALVSPSPLPSPYAKLVACPRCEKRWPSPDSRVERYCSDACREEATHEDGQWMNGAVVTLKASMEFTAWEVRALGL